MGKGSPAYKTLQVFGRVLTGVILLLMYLAVKTDGFIRTHFISIL